MMQINPSIQPTEKALELIDGLLETRKDTHDSYQLVLRKVNLLLEQNEEQKANETIHQYPHLTEIRETEVEKSIVCCQCGEAIRLLDEGIEIAKEEIYPGTDSKRLEIKLKIYETTNRIPEVIDTCRLLFVTGRDRLAYYNKFKALILKEQWKNFLDAMMKEIEFSNYFSFGGSAEADIYVKEQDNERLLTLLLPTRYDQLEVLTWYAHYLKGTHLERLIAMYTSSLNDYAERKTGRRNYEFIA